MNKIEKRINNVNQAVTGSSTIKVEEAVRNNVNMAAVLSKFVNKRNNRYANMTDKQALETFNSGFLKTISSNIRRRISENETATKILPDLKLSGDILISTILSPVDLITIELNHEIKNNYITSEISNAIISYIKSYVEDDYKLLDKLPKILKEMIMVSGSYPIAVIPENSLDYTINKDFLNNGGLNTSSEEFRKNFTVENDNYKVGSISPLGFLGPDTNSTTTIKSTHNNDISKVTNSTDSQLHLINVTDNFNILKLGNYINKKNKLDIKDIISKESFVLGKNTYGQEITHILKTDNDLKRETVGHPLIMNLPAMATIPVFVPGSPEKQVGVFVLLDENGYPVDVTDINNSKINGMAIQSTMEKLGVSMDIIKSSINMGNSSINTSVYSDIFSKIVETNLLNRLKSGVYKSSLEIANKDDIYQIMLARVLCNKLTNLLFIPSELVTYFALEYDDNGIGKSLIEQIDFIIRLRATLQAANVMAACKNAVTKTVVNVKFDEDDPDPRKTKEIIMEEVARSKSSFLPNGITIPDDIVSSLQKASIEFQYSGHPGMPDTTIDFTEKNSSYSQVDSSISDELKIASIMHMGLTPEMVDNAYSPDFATSAVQNNTMLSKRVLSIQSTFNGLISDHVRKIIFNSAILKKEIVKILSNDKNVIYKYIADKYSTNVTEIENKPLELYIPEVVEDLINDYTIALPKPETISMKQQSQELDEYIATLDKVLGVLISSESLPATLIGDMSDRLDEIKGVYKASLVRNKINNLGMFKDLNLLEPDSATKLGLSKTHQNNLEQTDKLLNQYIDLIKAATKNVTKTNTKYQKIKENIPEPTESSSDSGSTDNNDDTGDSDPDGGMDDMMGDMGNTGDDTNKDKPDDTKYKVDDTADDNTPADDNKEN